MRGQRLCAAASALFLWAIFLGKAQTGWEKDCIKIHEMQDYVSSKAKMGGEFSGFKAGLCTNIAAQWKNCAQAPLCAEYPGKTPCNCGENMKIIGNYVIFWRNHGNFGGKISEIIRANPQAQPKFLWGSVETVDNSVEKDPELWITRCFC